MASSDAACCAEPSLAALALGCLEDIWDLQAWVLGAEQVPDRALTHCAKTSPSSVVSPVKAPSLTKITSKLLQPYLALRLASRVRLLL